MLQRISQLAQYKKHVLIIIMIIFKRRKCVLGSNYGGKRGRGRRSRSRSTDGKEHERNLGIDKSAIRSARFA